MRFSSLLHVCLTTIVLGSLPVNSPNASAADALSPEDELKTFTVAEGLEAELFASEPFVRQPVSLSFDDRGRMWVLQYIQYPNPEGLKPVEVDRYLRTKYDKVPEPPPRGPRGNDTIAILEDTDGDGRADRAKNFLTGLNLASGMALGHGGVFVAQPPYLLFYADRNGDDVPDGDPDVLLKGFGMNDAHAFANSLTWGPDGWLYGAQGSTVTADIRGIGFQQGIWRYHPLTREFELFAEGGGNTWGIDFDSLGNLFAGGNTVEPLCHHVQGAYYVKGFGKHGPLHNPYTFGYFMPVKHHGYVGDSLTGGFVIYQGGIFGERFSNACIAPNTRHNAIRYSSIEPRGSTFATRFGGDFITSTDVWFRAVDSIVGPDGALYVADWYDVNISHTSPKDRSQWYVPSRTDGRIWRIVPKGTNPRPIDSLSLDTLANAELIELLSHANDWYARHARRILAERRDRALLPDLKQMLLSADDDRSALQALWSLYVGGGFDDALAARLLEHESAPVRAWTIRLLGDEKKLAPQLRTQLVELAANEPSPVVRSQLACTCKRLPGGDALPIVSVLLGRDEDVGDPHIPLLLWWAIEDKSVSHGDAVLDLVASRDAWQQPLIRDTIARRLARRYLAEGTPACDAACARLLVSAPGEAEREIVISGMEEQIAGRKLDRTPAELEPHLSSLLAADSPTDAVIRLSLRLGMPEAYQAAIATLVDPSVPDPERLAFIGVLGEIDRPECVPVLLKLLAGSEPEPVQLGLLDALQSYDDGSIAAELLARYPQMSPKMQSRVRDLLSSRRGSSLQMLAAVDAGTIDEKSVTLDQLRQLRLHGDARIEQRVEKRWGSVRPSTLREKQGRIMAVSQMLSRGKGDPHRGKPLFAKHCGTCHQLFGEGTKIGPDLTGADRKNMNVLLMNVIDSSAVVRQEYRTYVAVTSDGRVLQGLLADSNDQTVTLLDGKNKRTVLDRGDVEELKASDVSLMPEKLLEPLDERQIRDLFAYLQGNGTVEVSSPGAE